jgi:hypothetical protein
VNALPAVVSGLKVDPAGRYLCPLCKVQRAGGEADTGWVACPMVLGQMICLGSCLDCQAAARSLAFETHHDRYLFIELALKTQQTERGLRAICLRHQVQIIDDRLHSRSDEPVALTALKDEVSHALIEATMV